MLLRIVLLLSVAFAATAATPRLPDPAELRIAHTTFRLDNGLTVVVHEDHAVPMVSVNVWYHVGSRDERRGRTGFAHLFEHFFFNGSEHYPHGFREAMDDLGATNRNGTTSGDRTNFFENVPTSALERTLYLEADRMGFLAANLSEAMLERERGVVQNEKRQGDNAPYGMVYDRLVETIYPYNHPYSWPTIGSMADLDAATLDDVKAWYQRYYGPNNAVLVLAGDISAERARELAQKYFAAIPAGQPVPHLRRWVPALDADLRDTLEDRVPQPRIVRAWHVPGWGRRDNHLLELLADVLSGSDSAPLNRRLVFETGLATRTSTFVWTSELAGVLIAQVDVKPGASVAEAERELDAVVQRMLADGPDEAALQRAQMRLLSGAARGIERVGGFGGRSDWLAEGATYGGDAGAHLHQFTHWAEATPERVRSAAQRWLSRHHYTLTVQPFGTPAAAQDTIDRAVLPALASPPEVTFPQVQRATLRNGMQVLLLERPSAPLVNIVLAFDAGLAADAGAQAGTARLATRLLTRGAGDRDAFELADARDALGATLNAWNTLDTTFVGASALRGGLRDTLALLGDVARRPTFPADMMEVERKQQLAAIEQERADPFGLAARLTPTLLYPAGHPYAQPGSGTGDPAVVAGLTRAQLAEWHARWMRPDNATAIVAGAIDLATATAELERVFGDWRASTAAAKPATTDATAARGKVYLLDRPDAPQSVIIAAHLTEPAGTPSDLAIDTVMRNFGGIATSRLNRNLRLDKHWSYGSYGDIDDARGPRTFSVVAPVQTDRTRDAMVEVLREIRGVAGERPLAGEEFESIKRNQVSTLPGRFETLDALVNAGANIVGLGRAPEFYYDYAANTRALTTDDLAVAAQRFVKPDELTWIVIGDLDRIEADVRGLNYGEIVELQPDGTVAKPQ